MNKVVDYICYVIIFLIVLGFLSEKFFPIDGLEIYYQRKYYLAILYILLRIYKNFALKRKDVL